MRMTVDKCKMEGRIEIVLKFSIECKVNEQLSLSRINDANLFTIIRETK